jgi:hypothetical protein
MANNTTLTSPATTEADVEAHTKIVASATPELTSPP